jgi:hypothetical protein
MSDLKRTSIYFIGVTLMKVGERQQQGRSGAKCKTICPKCGKEYLKTAGGKKGKLEANRSILPEFRLQLYCRKFSKVGRYRR